MSHTPEMKTAAWKTISYVRNTTDRHKPWYSTTADLRNAVLSLIPTVDEIAQRIRTVDGNNRMGAGALAEEIYALIISKATQE